MYATPGDVVDQAGMMFVLKGNTGITVKTNPGGIKFVPGQPGTPIVVIKHPEPSLKPIEVVTLEPPKL